MRCIPLLAAGAAFLAGCSTTAPVLDAWSWDATRPPVKAALPAPEHAALTNRIAQLQIERNDIRARISAQPDIWARQALYAQLHDVGMQLSPLERRLSLVTPAR